VSIERVRVAMHRKTHENPERKIENNRSATHVFWGNTHLDLVLGGKQVNHRFGDFGNTSYDGIRRRPLTS
jgi:hypothetical protein